MNTKILLAAVLSLGLGTSAAMAQSASDQNTESEAAGQLPETWGPEINDTFFSDMEAGVLRAEDEVRTRWAALTAEQQAQVREECETVSGAEATGTDGAAATEVTSFQQICTWTQ